MCIRDRSCSCVTSLAVGGQGHRFGGTGGPQGGGGGDRGGEALLDGGGVEEAVEQATAAVDPPQTGAERAAADPGDIPVAVGPAVGEGVPQSGHPSFSPAPVACRLLLAKAARIFDLYSRGSRQAPTVRRRTADLSLAASDASGVADQIDRAARDDGFFLVVGPGVPSSLRTDPDAAARGFFAPAEATQAGGAGALPRGAWAGRVSLGRELGGRAGKSYPPMARLVAGLESSDA